MRWHYRDPLLVWLLPASYALHILEEWFGGFPIWMATVIGSPLPAAAFIVINAVALSAMVLATHAVTRREACGWMGVAIATILFVNALAHVLGTLATRTYSTGLFTSVILYLPLSQLVLFRAWRQAEGAAFRQGVVAGLGLHVLVLAIAFGVSACTRLGSDPSLTPV
jgi:hypothetical protein